MRAARAVRRAVGVMLAGERDDAGLVIGVEQQVDRARAVPAGEHHAARPLREHGTDQLLRFCLLGASRTWHQRLETPGSEPEITIGPEGTVRSAGRELDPQVSVYDFTGGSKDAE